MLLGVVEDREVGLVALESHVFLDGDVVKLSRPRSPREEAADALVLSVRGGRLVEGDSVDWPADDGGASSPVEAVANERADIWLAVDKELRGLIDVAFHSVGDLLSLVGFVPVEVKGDEHVEVTNLVGGGVGVVKLILGVRVGTDVQSKSSDTLGLGNVDVLRPVVDGVGVHDADHEVSEYMLLCWSGRRPRPPVLPV